VLDHPGEDLARIGRELQLQQLLPHLLLAAAEIGDVGGEHAGARDQLAPERQHRVERGAHVGTVADVVAEIDEAITGAEARVDGAMQSLQTRGLAVDGGDSPHASTLAQHRELVAIGHARRFPEASCNRSAGCDSALANHGASHGTETAPMQKALATLDRESLCCRRL
jgi:hypothetical protein